SYGISISSSLASAGSNFGHAVLSRLLRSPSVSHNSCARYGANGASMSTKLHCTSRTKPAGHAPGEKMASAAMHSFRNSIKAATEVLKCHRPLKSWVIFLMVWCSFRSIWRASGERSSTEYDLAPSELGAGCCVMKRYARARYPDTARTPESDQSSSLSG